jgi:hypothetical protein
MTAAQFDLSLQHPLITIKKPVHCGTGEIFGGDDGIRTHDLSVANAALSQLSYVPFFLARIFHQFTPWRDCYHGYGRPSLRARLAFL